MRIVFILCIVFQSVFASAQSDNPVPRILAIDTTINIAERFNSAVTQFTPGFRFIGADNSIKGEVLYSYTDGGGGFLRLKYKYIVEHDKQRVIYQSITADLAVIIPIINGLFNTNMGSDVQSANSVSGPVSYHGREYQCLMQADEFKAGYWVLSFVKA